MPVTARPRVAVPVSCSSTASVAGTQSRAHGWAGNASAASSTSSTPCCAAPTAPPSWSRGEAPRHRPSGVRYVITLDSDTRLPRGAAARLVGTMAHPLNRPVFDAHAGRVVDGHAILQPRVTTTLPAEHEASIFQRVYSGSAGIDPYASAVSDVYQDLFGEGTYTGKGIYDLDVFEAALVDRAPENTLLSHDLLEGTFARAGAGHRHRALRRVALALRGGRGTPAPLGTRRLAAPALDPGPAARRDGPAEPDPWHRALEDDRQPAPDARRPVGAGDAAGGLDAALGVSRPVDRVRPGHDDRAGCAARAGGTAAAAAGHFEAQSPSGRGHRPRRSPQPTWRSASCSSPIRPC